MLHDIELCMLQLQIILICPWASNAASISRLPLLLQKWYSTALGLKGSVASLTGCILGSPHLTVPGAPSVLTRELPACVH